MDVWERMVEDRGVRLCGSTLVTVCTVVRPSQTSEYYVARNYSTFDDKISSFPHDASLPVNWKVLLRSISFGALTPRL